MKKEFISTENMVLEYLKRTMYALMVIVIAIAVPVLGYLELSYNPDKQDKKENTEKVQSYASSAMKQQTVKL